MVSFFFSSRRRHTRYWRDWSSDVCSSDLVLAAAFARAAVADHDVGTGLLLEHEGEVLRAREWRGVGLDILAADRHRRRLDRERGLLGRVDQRRIAAVIFADRRAATGLRDAGRHFGQAPLEQRAHLGLEAARGAL